MAASHVDVMLLMSKIAIGAPQTGGEFMFGIFNQGDTELYTATNDKTGLITFHAVRFTSPGVYHYTVKEISAPAGWDIDTTEWPVEINVTLGADNKLHAIVTYPNGTPVFIDTHQCAACGLVEFPELTFTVPGVYEYTLREKTPSGGGWTTDDSIIKVIVNVVDDGHGNLIATICYPDGFPTFTNIYEVNPACIIISACKTAIGAPLPAGRFEFGLFDEDGELISSVTNGPADETSLTSPDGDDDE